MHLDFHYSANEPYILHQDNNLRVGVLNPTCANTTEHWKLPPGEYSQHRDFHRLQSADYLVGAASVKVSPETLADTTQSLYQQILTDHPEFSLYRIWHFVPQINDIPVGKLENYRAFCLGRSLAFEAHAHAPFHAQIPAASAVGTTGEHLTIVYLAGTPLGTHIENPRQIPAYLYPEQYGPKAPAFARATSVDYNSTPTLFISGTSSILASESIGDTIEAQLETTLENLRIVAAQTPTPYTGKRRVRIYLRHAHDYDYVKAQMDAQFLSSDDHAIYIVAEICRKELLVEIEATLGL
jgi:chorismate lyase / 3-hydroxybenzoate synthase